MINVDSDISDELFAAFLDGNTSSFESNLVENALLKDDTLSFAKRIVTSAIDNEERSPVEPINGDSYLDGNTYDHMLASFREVSPYDELLGFNYDFQDGNSILYQADTIQNDDDEDDDLNED